MEEEETDSVEKDSVEEDVEDQVELDNLKA